MGELRAMDGTGDTKMIWDASKPDEVEAAKSAFDKLKAKGYRAFAVKDNGESGAQILNFDPKEGKIIMVPQMRGG